MNFLTLSCKKIILGILIVTLGACGGGGGGKKATPPTTVTSSSSSPLSSTPTSSSNSSGVPSTSSAVASLTSTSSISSSSTSVAHQFSIKGVVTDAVIANAHVTISIGDKTFTTTANVQGEYDILLSVTAQYLDKLVMIIATGIDEQANVVLVSLLPSVATLITQAGDDKILEKRENFAVNVTNMTTAEFALIQRNNNLPTTENQLHNVLLGVVFEEKITLAALLKIIIDQPGFNLPTSFADTLAFAKDRVATEKFGAEIEFNRQQLLDEMIDAIKEDGDLVPAASKLAAGKYIVDKNSNFSNSYWLDLNADGSGRVSVRQWHADVTWSQSNNLVHIQFLSPLQINEYGYTVSASGTELVGISQVSTVTLELISNNTAVTVANFIEHIEVAEKLGGNVIRVDVTRSTANIISQAKTVIPDDKIIPGTWFASNNNGLSDKLDFNADGTGQLTPIGSAVIRAFAWHIEASHIALRFNDENTSRNIWMLNELAAGYRIVFADTESTVLAQFATGFFVKRQDVHLTRDDIIGFSEMDYYWSGEPEDEIMQYSATGIMRELYSSNYYLGWSLVDEHTWIEKTFLQNNNYVPKCEGEGHCVLAYSRTIDVLAQDDHNFYMLSSFRSYENGELLVEHMGDSIGVFARHTKKYPERFDDWFVRTNLHSVQNGQINYWHFSRRWDALQGKYIPYVYIGPKAIFDNVPDDHFYPYKMIGGRFVYTDDGIDRVVELIEARENEMIVCTYESGSNCQAGVEFSLLANVPEVL